jgi:integrase
MPLTALAIKQAKPDRTRALKLYDGGGLYLLLLPRPTPASRRRAYWRLKYRFAGKEKLLALGVSGDGDDGSITLAKAREKRDAAKTLLEAGIDPSASRREQKRLAEYKAVTTFEAIAREWWEAQKAAWSETHADGTLERLENELFPRLGSRPIVDIEPPEVLEALRAIEKRGALEIAKKTRVVAGQVFRYAIATGRAKSDPSRDLRGALKTRETRHYSALTRKELPEFLGKLAAYDGNLLTRLALRLLILTFVRTGELRGAQWSEFDLEHGAWRIPGERMKMGEEHIVPLSRQALAVIEEIRPISGKREHVFPNEHHPLREMSENTILFALYRMGYRGRATGHGFRATASTILNEMGFRSDVIERQLAHAERNKIRAAYNRAEYLPERRQMMQAWADLLDDLAKPKQKVIPMRSKKRA